MSSDKVSWFGAGLSVAFYAVALGSVATAQTRPGTVAPAAAENYDPKGLPVGSFRLFPTLDLVEMYNDNIYATGAKTGSFVSVIRPQLDLRSDWNNHMLNMLAYGAFGFYSANAGENYQDFGVGFNGRVDIQRNWNLFGGASIAGKHEERGSANAAFGGDATRYLQTSANLGYYQKINRFSARLEGAYQNYSFLNNKSLGTVGVVANNQDRDRNEFAESLRLGYEFIEKYEVWIQGGMNQRLYNNQFDISGIERNSFGWEILGGATVDFGGITQIEAFAGYREQSYRDGRLGSLRGATFGLSGIWNPIVPLYIKPYVKRTIEETVFSAFSGFWSTSVGIDVDYKIRPNVQMTAGASYTRNEYTRNATAAGLASTDRNDNILDLSIGVKYYPTENFYVGPVYQFTNRTSDFAGLNYDRHLIALRGGVLF